MFLLTQERQTLWGSLELNWCLQMKGFMRLEKVSPCLEKSNSALLKKPLSCMETALATIPFVSFLFWFRHFLNIGFKSRNISATLGLFYVYDRRQTVMHCFDALYISKTRSIYPFIIVNIQHQKQVNQLLVE